MAPGDRESDDLIFQHFFKPGHNGLDNISIQIIAKVDDEDILEQKEDQWAYRFKTIRPEGLMRMSFLRPEPQKS